MTGIGAILRWRGLAARPADPLGLIAVSTDVKAARLEEQRDLRGGTVVDRGSPDSHRWAHGRRLDWLCGMRHIPRGRSAGSRGSPRPSSELLSAARPAKGAAQRPTRLNRIMTARARSDLMAAVPSGGMAALLAEQRARSRSRACETSRVPPGLEAPGRSTRRIRRGSTERRPAAQVVSLRTS